MKYLNTILCCAIAFATPMVAMAEPTTPVINRSSNAAILKQKDIVASMDAFKKFDLSRLQLIRRLGFVDGDICVAPVPIAAPAIDIHRTLFIHDDATLKSKNFSLRRTLQKLSTDVSGSVPGTNPETIFKQFMDTQNDTPNQAAAGNPHCDDNNGKINGYPLNKCPRPEGIEAAGTTADISNRIDNEYKPLALVNRIDLADKGWKNCGEHRIVYGKNNGSKNLIIFEAVLPNPKPGCRSGCRDVIDFWVDLSNDPIPSSRAGKLETFFYTGLPGFRPVVHTSHYSSGVSSVYGGSGSGQIRTNQFLFRTGMGTGPWTLKEFKTFLSCAGGSCDYDIMPISVKVNPYGVLWNRDVATGASVPPLPAANGYATAIPGLAALATEFQSDVLAQVTVDKLANPDINSITYEVKPNKNSAESQSQGPTIDNYPSQFASATDATFRNNLDAVAATFGLSGAQIVNRATANSCAGCHLPNGFGLTNPNSIGPGMSWPSALSFVHVDTEPMTSLAGQPGFNPANFAGNDQGFNISPALLTTFLPARANNLVNLANEDVCDCVPKLKVLTPKAELRERQNVILQQSGKQLKKQLDESQKSFSARPKLVEGDMKQHFAKQRELISKVENARIAELEQAGMKTETPSLIPVAINLSATKVPADKLRKMKIDKVNEIVNSEPPRETIIGSFRSH